jgi:FixJ family two-component response regulator
VRRLEIPRNVTASRVTGGELLPGIVYIVDDDASFHSAIRRRLMLAGYEVEAYSSAEQFLAAPKHDDSRPACLLLDVRIPGLGGLGLQAHLLKIGSTLPVVFVSGYDDTRTVVQTVRDGAEDFLIKPVPSHLLLEAIERAILRHEVTRKRQSELNILLNRVAKLSPRERQVYDLIIRGKINKQIAFELGTTERTIKAHRHQVMEKMGAKSLAELLRIAGQLGHTTV